MTVPPKSEVVRLALAKALPEEAAVAHDLTRARALLDAGDVAGAVRTLQALPERTTRPALPSLEARALRVGNDGPRLATGLPTLDKMTRGGFPMGKRLTLTGAPGACKTGLALHLAAKWAREGVHVGIVAADEDADAILIRLGQAERLSRDDLEAGIPAARAELAAIVRNRYPTLLLVDQDEDGWTIDDLVEELRERAGKGPAVIVADSYQTLRVRDGAGGGSESRREQMDAVVRHVKRITAGMLLVVTSEMARAGYRNRKAGENIADIASAAETRAIEFQATTMLTLRSVADEGGGLVDVTVPKNRLGKTSQQPAFRLEWDFARASLVEVDVPDENEREARIAARLGEVGERVIQALLRESPLSKRRLVDVVKKNRDLVVSAIDALVDAGRIELVNRQAGYRLKVIPVIPSDPEVHPGSLASAGDPGDPAPLRGGDHYRDHSHHPEGETPAGPKAGITGRRDPGAPGVNGITSTGGRPS